VLNRYREARTQRGAALMEALIALFLVAFGLLAMAGMQLRALTETRNSGARNTAAQLATDLLDRMLVNGGARAVSPAFSPYLAAWGGVAAPATNCLNSPCDGSQLARFDLWQVKSAVSQQLPEGDLMVFRSPTDANQIGVLFRWRRLAAQRESTALSAVQQLFAAADEVRDGLGQSGTGVAGVTCTSGFTCHLTYLRP
jgi:type IV pilus assembly protein PilV